MGTLDTAAAPALPENLASKICQKAGMSEDLSSRILSGLRRLEQRLLGIGQEKSQDRTDPAGGFLSFLDTNSDNINANLQEAMDTLARIEKEIE